MDAHFSAEQLALRDLARDLFAGVNPPARVRELLDGRVRDRKVWQQLAEVGLTGIGVPEAYGGMGGGAADLVLVHEQAGWHGLPEPLTDSVAVAAPVLVAAGGEVAAAWLPRLAAGEALITVRLVGDPFVTDADDADAVLVEDGGALWLVPAAGVAVARQVRTEDGTRRRFAATVDLAAGTRLDVPVDVARTRAVAATAAELVGVCQRLVDDTVAYAKVRRQFDTPIGAFQAIQHTLADLFVLVESARGAARHAARRIAAGAPDAAHAAAVAKVAAIAASRAVNTGALQVHGGIGFTWEHDLHLELKRGLALEHHHGGARDLRSRLAADLIDGEER
jgi:alkylation response protein AidB-like acyl-CoA dehydrogenase